MPIQDAPSKPKSWADIEEPFVVFYASRGDDGVMWCPDCRSVESFVKETFEAEDAPSSIIIYVGTREQWKTPNNEWRKQPWNIQSIPTIVRIRDDERLVMPDQIKQNLKKFIAS